MFSRNQILFSSNFFSNLCFFSILAILALYFSVDCHFSASYSGMLMFFVVISSRMGRVILLPFLKEYKAKTALLISSILMCVGYFALYFSKIKWLMFIAFFILGVGYGCNSVYVRSFVGISTSSSNKTKLSYVNLSVLTNLSAALGALLAVYIFSYIGGEYVFLYASVLMLISAYIIYLYFECEESQNTTMKMRHALLFIWRTPGVSYIFIATILSWVMYIQLFSALPLLINNQLAVTPFLGSLYATNTMLIVFFSAPINKYLLRFEIDVYTFIIIGFIFIGCGFILLYLLPTLLSAYFSVALWTLGEILIIPSLNSSLSELTKGAERLHVFAFNGVAIGLGEGAGMYIGTMLTGLQPASQISHIYLYLSWILLFFLGIILILKWVGRHEN